MSSDSAREHTDVLKEAQFLHDGGRHAEAEALLIDALASGTATTAVYSLLARIQRALNEPVREARALEQAIATTSAEAVPAEIVPLWARLGAVREWQGDLAGALAAYERAARVEPANAVSQQGIARVRLAQQDLDGARRSGRELERLFPEVAFTHLFAGHIHKAYGEVHRAFESYSRALELEPTLGEALYNLVDLSAAVPTDETSALVTELAAREELAAADRINANFAHARILDRAGRCTEAFERFRTANEIARDELRRRGIEYVPSRIEGGVTRTINDFSVLTFGSGLDALPVDLVPIFIIGLPRSGTTLIEQILASHRDVQAAGEVLFARESERCFRQCRAGRTGPVDPADPLDAELLESAREQYVEKLFERDLDGPWVVDKLPGNFAIAGFLRLMFPQSPIVHSVRDPRATCFSLYCANFNVHEPWYHDLADLAHYHGQYRRLMSHWHKVIPAPFVDVVYEQLVSDPQSGIPALLQAIGLPFDPACLEFHRYQRPILTASHAEVRRPIYTSAINHWQRYAEWLGPVRDL